MNDTSPKYMPEFTCQCGAKLRATVIAPSGPFVGQVYNLHTCDKGEINQTLPPLMCVEELIDGEWKQTRP
jgi:hypothetical protein